MKYIIMCGGNYKRWQTPKQLIEICKEPIVQRTLRLFSCAGVDDIAISTHDERFMRFGVELIHHNNNFSVLEDGVVDGSWMDCFCPLQEPACYVLGDVVFSPAAVKTIVETQTNDVMFFASAPPYSDQYFKKHAEPFAFKVADQRRFRAAIEFIKASETHGIFGRKPIAWELWQVLNGENVNDINFYNYTAINDYTCDIDTPGDAIKIEEVLRRVCDDSCLSGADVVCD